MEENAAAVFEVRTGDSLAPWIIGIECRGPQHDVLAVERAVALTNRHGRLPRVEPNGSEAVRLGVEAGDSGAGRLGPVRIEEGEIRLQKLAILDHVLLASAFRQDWLAVRREESLDEVLVARKLC